MKTWQKLLLVGCGCLVIVGGIVAALVVFGGLKLGSFLQSSTDIIDYNNNLVDERDKIVAQLDTLTATLNFGTYEQVEADNQKLRDEIAAFEQLVSSTSVPSGADKIKQKNEEYASIAIEIADTVDEVIAAEKQYDLTKAEELIQEYNNKVDELNAKNVEIARLLNEIVEFEAIPEEDILNLE